MTLKYLLRKEFKQFFRNPFLPKLVIAFPVIIMLVIPWIVNMDIKNIRLTVVDKDGSSTSGKLTRTLEASDYFILEDVTGSYPEALRQLEKGRTDAVVEIPRYFEQGLVTEGRAQVQISLNAVNQIKGTLGANYLNAVCADFFAENFAPVSVGIVPTPKVNISVLNKFNPYMDYKNFMIPQELHDSGLHGHRHYSPWRLSSSPEYRWREGERNHCADKHHACPQDDIYLCQADSILDHGTHSVIHLHAASPDRVRVVTERQHLDRLPVLPPFHLRPFRIRAGSFQLFRHHAAGHVRHVLLHIGFHANERTAHPHILHAPMGAGHHLVQPSEILHRDDERRLSARMLIGGAQPPASGIAGL